MKESGGITQEEFDALLKWLDPDPERAAEKLNHTRAALVKMFISRGCFEAEEAADETIDRVAKKLKDIIDNYEGDPARYFHGVAKYVLLECLKPIGPPPIIPEPDPFPEQQVQCLEECMEKLSPDARYKVREYHRFDGREKINHREKLAKDYGLTLTALRIQVHRILKRLKPCVTECIARREQDSVS